MENKEERIKELERLIPYYAEKYYNGEEEICDSDFDQLTEELEQLNPNSEILKKVGWGSEEYGQKYDHKYQIIGSLNKTREWKNLPEKFKTDIILSQKLDGLSAVVQYENGKLIKALTRGNGKQGIDITSKLKKILKCEMVLDNFTGEVRGELIMSQENWEKVKELQPELSNQRNTTAGIINSKEIDEELLNFVDFVVYKITGSENKDFKDLEEVRSWLLKNFKNVVTSYKINSDVMSNKEMWDFQSKEFYTKIYPKYGYQIDGIVLSLNNIEKQENGAIMYDEWAYKFEGKIYETVVKGIEWNISKNQRVIPVVLVETVNIDGVNVNRVTGNNAKYIKENNIKKGIKIKIIRSNEVIPKIVGVIKDE